MYKTKKKAKNILVHLYYFILAHLTPQLKL